MILNCIVFTSCCLFFLLIQVIFSQLFVGKNIEKKAVATLLMGEKNRQNVLKKKKKKAKDLII